VFNSYISATLTHIKFKAIYLATKPVLENKIAITGRSNRVAERMLAFLQSP
jgi:hypothetical protein